MSGAEARRSVRVVPRVPTPAVDVMWDRVLGFVQDISSGGLKLLASRPLVQDGLYQVQLPLELGGAHAEMIEAGVQVVSQRSTRDGDAVAGMRFIHLPKRDAQRLSRWLEGQLPAA